MQPITVLIVEDHLMVRKGLRMTIESHPDLTVVGEAGSLAEAIEVATRVTPQVITLDLSMPGPSGVASVERLRAVVPGARIVIVTMHDDPAYVRCAMAMGAAGYVNKSAADSELISAIRTVAEGRIYLGVADAATIEAMTSPDEANASGSPLERLSEREREVLRRVAHGVTNQRIADELGLSVKTVESYRARLMKKLGFKDRADLVRLAIEIGLM
jgi:two-component system response regulator NreC